MKYPI